MAQYVLQLCHGYDAPFADVARQYASLFKGRNVRVITVFLTGKSNPEVITEVDSDEVLFLENTSKELRGLKRKQIQQVKQLHAQYGFKLILAHRYKAVFISCHIKQVPVVGIHHAFGDYQRFMRRWFVYRHKNRLALLGVSNAIRDDLRSSLVYFPEDRIQTLYNRINVEQLKASHLDKNTAREKLGIAQDRYVFANVGRLHPDKDQKTLIDAFARIAEQMPNTCLVIIGKGRLEQILKEQVKLLGLQSRVFFPGTVKDARRYFTAFDCFVLSSDYEPFGMVLLEAIAANVPVLATSVGGASEIITDPQYLFDVGDTKRLSKLMRDLYQMDADSINKLKENNYCWMMQNFTDDAVYKTFWSYTFIQQFLNTGNNKAV